MQNIKTTLWISLFSLGLFFIFTSSVRAEIIRDFSSTINVLPDSSILVKEKITYDFEKSIRQGIHRTIPLFNSKNEPMEVKIVSVMNELDEVYKFNTDISGGILNIKIGDPDMMISGVKEYNISYRVFGSIAYYKDFDEIYWNATGNDWNVPIQKVEATVVLPNNVFPIQQACYLGKSGSTENCKIIQSNIFTSDVKLNEKESLAVAVGFPKGVVSVYEQKVESPTYKFIKIFWPIIIPISILLYMFGVWLKKGKDPKGTGIISPQYDVPDNLTPLEVGGILNGKIKDENISAEIIYLATKGYLKIKKIDCDSDNFLLLVSNKDYELTLLKEKGLLQNSFDKKIITSIFGEDTAVGGVVKLSKLNNIFYKSIPDIENSVISTLLSKKYYTNFPKHRYKENTITGCLIFGLFILTNNFNGVANNQENFKRIFILIASVVASIITLLIFNRLMPAKSYKGVSIKDYLLGLKEYLQIAEKDRVHFHNAPEKKPEIFEHLLPYAMVFGVEELWAKEFKDIYINRPEWYESKLSNFNAVNFGAEMTMFSSLAVTSISSHPPISLL